MHNSNQVPLLQANLPNASWNHLSAPAIFVLTAQQFAAILLATFLESLSQAYLAQLVSTKNRQILLPNRLLLPPRQHLLSVQQSVYPYMEMQLALLCDVMFPLHPSQASYGLKKLNHNKILEPNANTPLPRRLLLPESVFPSINFVVPCD